MKAVNGVEIAKRHPDDELLRADRLPHIWCPGCGLGIVTKVFVESIRSSGIPLDRHVVVSGIGCTSRLPGYLNLDTYHTTHGRAIPFATGLKIANPELEVTVIAGDGDLLNIGGNHLIHAIRRNVDLNVFCVNNLNYGMTGGQFSATTPTGAKTATTPYGNYEAPFNVPYLVAAAGAPFVARWTTVHLTQLFKAMQRAFQIHGIAFIEIISPCPPTFGELNSFEDGYAQMEYLRKYSVIDDHADLRRAGISMKEPEQIVLGNFIDERKSTYEELETSMIRNAASGQNGAS